jgi:hypothetical protein
MARKCFAQDAAGQATGLGRGRSEMGPRSPWGQVHKRTREHDQAAIPLKVNVYFLSFAAFENLFSQHLESYDYHFSY